MSVQTSELSKALIIHAAFGVGYYSFCSKYTLLTQEALRSQMGMFAISTGAHTLLQSSYPQEKFNATDILPFALITLAKVQEVTWKVQALCTTLLSSFQIAVNHSLSLEGLIPLKNPETQWLSNFDIHTYAEHLEHQYPQLFAAMPFSTPLELKGLPQYVIDGMKKGSEKTVFSFPLHVTKNHWTLIYINRDQRTVEYYDSKQTYGNYQEIITTLKALTETLNTQFPGDTPYQFTSKIQKCLQPDIYQCGVWLLYFLEELLKDPTRDFNALDMASAQKMIAKHRKTLIPYFSKSDWDS